MLPFQFTVSDSISTHEDAAVSSLSLCLTENNVSAGDLFKDGIISCSFSIGLLALAEHVGHSGNMKHDQIPPTKLDPTSTLNMHESIM